MIKRIIFDIDNTLIPWEKQYDDEVKYTLEEMNIPYNEQELKNIDKAISEYENVNYILDKEKMSKFINEYTKKEYPKNFLERILERWAECVPNETDKNLIDVLEYLKEKYELVILTDWFLEEQQIRLEKMNIWKYFSNIYTSENKKRKPFKEAFEQAIGKNKPEECIMIGDNIERDVQGAINAGLEAIYYCKSAKIIKSNKNGKYITINKFEELKEIL